MPVCAMIDADSAILRMLTYIVNNWCEKQGNAKLGTENAMEREDDVYWFHKVLEILKPFLIYYVVFSIAFLMLISLCNAAAAYLGTGAQEYLTEHFTIMTQLVNSASMVIAVLPLIPMLRRELHGQTTSKTNGLALKTVSETRQESGAGHRVLPVLFVVLLAVSSSVGLNILLALTGFVQSSASYQEVSRQQYGIAFGMGAVLFGLISPVAEEIVFRGLVFNRMLRYYPAAAAVVVSGALFGIYHGNPVQMVYGTCMGMLMAYMYLRMRSFYVPCLFHAVANLTVYSLAQNEEWSARLFTIPGCAVLLVISAICIFIMEKLWKAVPVPDDRLH